MAKNNNLMRIGLIRFRKSSKNCILNVIDKPG